MTILSRQWSKDRANKLLDLAVNASLQGNLWFGMSNKTVLTSFATTLRNETGENYTYESVLLKLNDLYMHHVTWQWVIQQPGLKRDPKSSMLVSTDEVWSRIIRENPLTALYKFTTERYKIPMMMVFNYTLRVATEVKEKYEGVDVIIISDSESDTLEIKGGNGENLEVDASTAGPGVAPYSSNGDTSNYSTASSPFPPKHWNK